MADNERPKIKVKAKSAAERPKIQITGNRQSTTQSQPQEHRPKIVMPAKATTQQVAVEVIGRPASEASTSSSQQAKNNLPVRAPTSASSPTTPPTSSARPRVVAASRSQSNPMVGRQFAAPFIPNYIPMAYGRTQTGFLAFRGVKRGSGANIEDLMAKVNTFDVRLRGVNNVLKGIETILKKEQRIRPGFSASWIIPNPPVGAKKIVDYFVEKSRITLFKLPNSTENLYHLTPYEYRLGEKHIQLLDLARKELLEHYPTTLQLNKPEQAREYVLNYSEKSLYKLALKYKISLGKSRGEERENLKLLGEILAKYTAGMGITEIFLKDKYIQDIYIDAPTYENPVYITLEGLEDARTGQTISGKYVTNVMLSGSDAESLLSRFRYESGRPFSEAMPVLECDLDAYDTRVTIIGSPLSPQGNAFALRRHSTDPWTLLKLIYYKSLSPLTAGLISFLVDGKSTILVSGSRGAGKTSLLGAIMLEIPQSQRILTIEDTLELPVTEMQQLGYKIQSMHVQSTLGGQGEMTADDALKVALRLGESAIVIGEVRGQEARTLYEAMRSGTAGSTVLGTIHANSAKAIYERVVYDMGIPAKSFQATDMVIIAGLIRPAGIQKQVRRVTQVAELLKESGRDGDFQDLLLYNDKMDALVETDAFKYNSEKIGQIAGSWGITMEEALQNIEARAKIREIIVEYARRTGNLDILKAKWVANSNNAFWAIVEQHYTKEGYVDFKKLVEEWKSWFKGSVRNA